MMPYGRISQSVGVLYACVLVCARVCVYSRSSQPSKTLSSRQPNKVKSS